MNKYIKSLQKVNIFPNQNLNGLEHKASRHSEEKFTTYLCRQCKKKKEHIYNTK